MSNDQNTDQSLLLDSTEGSEDSLQNALYQKLILQAAAAGGLDVPGALDGNQEQPVYSKVQPEPGFCIKTRDEKGSKIFINICKTDGVPPAKDITDEELAKVLESDEPDYRVPMSIADPHAEVDKGGKGCTAYDIAINPQLLDRTQKSDLFRGFFMSVVYEGLENKYGITMDRNWVQLKNKKSVGTLTEHHIRARSKPRISEMDSSSVTTAPSLGETTKSSTNKPLITELDSSSSVTTSSKAPSPEYVIMREPLEGHPEFLVAEVKLPKLKSAKLLSLDLGEDHIVLHAHPNLYYLDIYLPFIILPEDSGAQFNRDTKVLTLTLPVQPL